MQTNFLLLYCFICLNSLRIVWLFAFFTEERKPTICIRHNINNRWTDEKATQWSMAQYQLYVVTATTDASTMAHNTSLSWASDKLVNWNATIHCNSDFLITLQFWWGYWRQTADERLGDQVPLVVRDRDGRHPRGPSGSALLLCV